MIQALHEKAICQEERHCHVPGGRVELGKCNKHKSLLERVAPEQQ